MNLSKPLRQHYRDHASRARGRGVAFLLTFEEWLEMWAQSGHLYSMGRKKGQYVMCRHGDIGPYSKDNVSIRTCSENHAESNTVSKTGKSNPLKGLPPPQITCPHCGLTGGHSIMKRWHFTRCRRLSNNI